jgi:transposase
VLCDSVVECKDDLTKESVADFFHSIRQKTPDRPIIVVCDNLLYNKFYYVIPMAENINLIGVALPLYSPNLTLIEQIWKNVKRDLPPRDVPNLDTYRSMICDVFHDYTDRLSFAEPGFSASYLSKTYDCQ